MKTLISGILIIFIAGCSTMNGVWEAGKTVVGGTVDAVVTGTSQIASAVASDVVNTTAFVVDTAAGVIEDTAEIIDENTDVIQDEKPEGK